MQNLLTIDLEDWYQLAHRRILGGLPNPSSYIWKQTDCILDLLRDKKMKATFFVLGILAGKFPQLVKQITKEGHEIASHGYDHTPAFRLSQEAFRVDAERSKKLLEDITGERVIGYRAAEFSIRSNNLWALEILAELGFRYDSSIFPIVHRRYGIPDFKLSVQNLNFPSGLSIIEFPLAVFSVAGLRFPYAGGGYFRLLPLWFTKLALKQMNRKQVPAAMYFHPYEFDPDDLQIDKQYKLISFQQKVRGAIFNFHQNLRRTSVFSKLSKLLDENHFIACCDFIRKAENFGNRMLEGSELLSK